MADASSALQGPGGTRHSVRAATIATSSRNAGLYPPRTADAPTENELLGGRAWQIAIRLQICATADSGNLRYGLTPLILKELLAAVARVIGVFDDLGVDYLTPE
jgi:hypothetical protein